MGNTDMLTDMEKIHLENRHMSQHYYKYRSLQNLRWFLDIIMNERLYASRYTCLNDPMEGVYITNENCRDIINLLKTKKYKTRICSLSKEYRDTRMWAYYADSHKGCCIEVSAKDMRCNPVDIYYSENLPRVLNDTDGSKLLSHKSSLWEYEQEVRFFRKTSWLNVNIHRIIFGMRVSKSDYDFYKQLIGRINPSIEIKQIQENEIIDGFTA